MTTFPSLFEHARATRDERVWQCFVDSAGPYVHRCLGRYLRDIGCPFAAEDLEDLTQDVYLRLLTLAAPASRAASRAEQVPMEEAQVRAYVIRVAVSVVVDRGRWRSAGKRRCAGLRGLGSLGLDSYPSPNETPEDRVLVGEHIELISASCRRVVGRVERQAKLRALCLVLFAGMQSREAARVCGGRVSASNIDVLVCRVRQHLAGKGIALPRRCGEPADRREEASASRAPALAA